MVLSLFVSFVLVVMLNLVLLGMGTRGPAVSSGFKWIMAFMGTVSVQRL